MRRYADHEPGEADYSGCRGCPIEDCPAGDWEDDSALSGWGLGLSSMGLFLGPGVLAIVGAICCGESRGAQFLGATAGLVIGMTGSVVLAKLLRRAGNAKSAKKIARPQ